MAKKKNSGYRYTAQDRDLRRRSCVVAVLLASGWPVLGAVATAKGWL